MARRRARTTRERRWQASEDGTRARTSRERRRQASKDSARTRCKANHRDMHVGPERRPGSRSRLARLRPWWTGAGRDQAGVLEIPASPLFLPLPLLLLLLLLFLLVSSLGFRELSVCERQGRDRERNGEIETKGGRLGER
ncbi:hypothetical protein B296_00056801 [Ensete ventricosum]|uniref:Uncharacterized protein n=1 Tax=Ensete ventricosum TaxID=4639 RepID=A0A426XDY8_ENSVE|nr:hypothetical protein B296_00056801 [Ensete ventricosum]